MKQGNTDYRQTYHFNQLSKRDENNSPSIAHDPDINTKIDENPYKQNVEIEKDEVVLRPDMTGIHKAGGKKHSQGGTGVYLPENSFIFSDDKTLSLDKNDFNLFELDGSNKKRLNTPAKIVQKNVDLEHYNSLIAVINDPSKDKVAKDTAMLMLQKYMGTLGNIAYIQEQKKSFPDGVPSISQGTAPVYDDDLKTKIEENKQYMKYGGKVGNPYMQQGGTHRDRTTGKLPPYPNQFSNYYDVNQKKQYNAPNWITPTDFYNTPGLVDYMKTLDHVNGVDNDLQKADDGQWGYRHQAALDKFYPKGYQVPIPTGLATENPLELPNVPKDAPVNNPYKIQPGNVTGQAQNGIPVDWQFTPFQKQSQFYNGMKWAGVDREMPMRSRYNATYTDPYLVNPEQTIADTKGMANQQMNSFDLLSPILSSAQKSAAYGDYLDKVPGIRSQYDNQNAQIMNQSRMYNNQIKNDETMRNNASDQQYYRESAVGRQNFKNMRGYMADQWMNNRNQDVQDNQSLAYQMLTLGPKPAYGYDWNSGNFYRNDKNILDVETNPQSQILSGVFNKYLNDPTEFSKLDPRVQSAIIRSAALKGLPLERYKKGGRIGKNPYK